MISTSITNNSITVIVANSAGNKVFTVNKTHANYEAILDAIRKNDEATVVSLCDISTTIETYMEGNVSVKNGHVYYGNTILNGIIVDRLLSFIKEKLPVQPLLKFINKLQQNPSARAVSELYSFLEHKNMPITPEGNFLAYKGVQSDYYSITSGNIEVIRGKVDGGKIYNGIGEEIVVRRNQVCDDKEVGCSTGLHAGSVKYATDFGRNGKVVIVEIDPADVVSVPDDCACQKLRTCRYKVVGEYSVPLDDSYCDSYSDCEDEDEDSDDGELSYDDYYASGYTDGYDDGVNSLGYDVETGIEDTQWQDESFQTAYKDGYQDGYDDGVLDRNA